MGGGVARTMGGFYFGQNFFAFNIQAGRPPGNGVKSYSAHFEHLTFWTPKLFLSIFNKKLISDK